MKWIETWGIFKLFRSLSLSDSWEIFVTQSKKTNPGRMAFVLFSFYNCCMFLNQLERKIHADYSVLTHVFIKGGDISIGFEDRVCVTWKKLALWHFYLYLFLLSKTTFAPTYIVIVRPGKIHMWNVTEDSVSKVGKATQSTNSFTIVFSLEQGMNCLWEMFVISLRLILSKVS